jgi:hypothetical protein
MREGRRLQAGAWVILGGFLPLVTGCTYGMNRLRDAADVVSIGLGSGLGVSARVTHYVEAGAEITGSGFRTVGRTVYAPVGVAGSFGLAPLWHFRQIESSGTVETGRLMVLGKSLLEATDGENWSRWYDGDIWIWGPSRAAYIQGFDRRLFDIGASLYLGLGIDLDFSLIEFCDFLAGVAGLDFAGDDGDHEAGGAGGG